jgi:large subunit ribosomal protein L10
MNRTQKGEIVAQLTERLRRSENMYLTDFTGIGVKPMTELRRKLRDAGVEYVVVKNTLALRALETVDVSDLSDDLKGPTAFVFAGPDPVSAAKVLTEFQKEYEVLTVKSGRLEGRMVTAEEVARLATLPSREQLLAQLGGAFQAPMQNFVGALSGLLYQFVGAVEALRAERAGA